MKNIQESLFEKEQELKRLEREISVLRAALAILNENEKEVVSSEVSVAGRAALSSSQPYAMPVTPSEREPQTAPSSFATFSRSSGMIEQVHPEPFVERPKRSFP